MKKTKAVTRTAASTLIGVSTLLVLSFCCADSQPCVDMKAYVIWLRDNLKVEDTALSYCMFLTKNPKDLCVNFKGTNIRVFNNEDSFVVALKQKGELRLILLTNIREETPCRYIVNSSLNRISYKTYTESKLHFFTYEGADVDLEVMYNAKNAKWFTIPRGKIYDRKIKRKN